jgi:hypothetical protein
VLEHGDLAAAANASAQLTFTYGARGNQVAGTSEETPSAPRPTVMHENVDEVVANPPAVDARFRWVPTNCAAESEGARSFGRQQPNAHPLHRII